VTKSPDEILALPGIAKLFKRTGVTDDDRGYIVKRYLDARAGFDAWATMDAPDLPVDVIESLQVQLARWQTRNFGIRRELELELACGIAEEVGERTVAILQANPAEVVDAVGDALVWGCQLATARRLSMRTVFWMADQHASWSPSFQDPRPDFATLRSRPPATKLVGIATGYICHVQVKAAQGVRESRNPEMARLGTFVGLVMLARAFTLLHDDPVGIFTDVTKIVLARDWTKDRSAGGETR
jgi:hypothetical protein